MISFEELPDALRPYASWSLSMWFYTVSHSELVLQLRHPDQYRMGHQGLGWSEIDPKVGRERSDVSVAPRTARS